MFKIPRRDVPLDIVESYIKSLKVKLNLNELTFQWITADAILFSAAIALGFDLKSINLNKKLGFGIWNDSHIA